MDTYLFSRNSHLTFIMLGSLRPCWWRTLNHRNNGRTLSWYGFCGVYFKQARHEDPFWNIFIGNSECFHSQPALVSPAALSILAIETCWYCISVCGPLESNGSFLIGSRNIYFFSKISGWKGGFYSFFFHPLWVRLVLLCTSPLSVFLYFFL
jgi:hypothetical protein